MGGAGRLLPGHPGGQPERWRDYGRAHREFFGEHRPATTMVEVKRLIDPAMLIEIEVDAVVA